MGKCHTCSVRLRCSLTADGQADEYNPDIVHLLLGEPATPGMHLAPYFAEINAVEHLVLGLRLEPRRLEVRWPNLHLSTLWAIAEACRSMTSRTVQIIDQFSGMYLLRPILLRVSDRGSGKDDRQRNEGHHEPLP